MRREGGCAWEKFLKTISDNFKISFVSKLTAIKKVPLSGAQLGEKFTSFWKSWIYGVPFVSKLATIFNFT